VYLELLELTDFRSYRACGVELGPGVRVFVGPNAQGKTNLLESVHYLATGGATGSRPTAARAPGASSALDPRVAAVGEDRGATVDPVGRRAPPGRHATGRASTGKRSHGHADAIGVVRSVLFAPEDLQLVRGDPADRRRFLDDLLAQRRPAYRPRARSTTGCSGSATPC
jgi:DNA replication and repair protein RecF